MARAGFLILKWLIVPLALAAAGYYIIGPRLGKVVASPDAKPATTAQDSTQPEAGGQQTAYPSPDVDVQVGTAAGGSRPRKHRRHKTKPTTPTSPTTSGPPTDQGGSGGAATTGGATTGGDAGGSGTGGSTGGTDG